MRKDLHDFRGYKSDEALDATKLAPTFSERFEKLEQRFEAHLKWHQYTANPPVSTIASEANDE